MNDLQPSSSAEWLRDIESRFDGDDAVPHIDYRDRIQLWKAMDIEHGVGEAECRRAILGARHVWPLIDVCERTVLDNSDVLPEWVDYLLPRKFLQISTEIHLKQRSPLNPSNVHQYQCQLDSLSDCMSVGNLEPESLIPLAVLTASLLLIHAKIDAVDQTESEFWQEVLENDYSDLIFDSCDWECRDTYFWMYSIRIGEIETDEKRDERTDFWRNWLKDVVDVNTRPLSDLNSELRQGLQ